MRSITRGMLRWGLIGGLALGGLTLLVGPERVAAGLAQVRTKAQQVVDNVVDDPVALRRQLQELAEAYPDRIAEVQGEIAEVAHQMSQIDRDVQIARRVVAMTTDDLTELKALVTRAENARMASSGRAVFIRFDGVRFDMNQAITEANRINQVRLSYEDRLDADEQQLAFLNEQKAQLAEILSTLETEYTTYQAKLWQLDRQIDAIERNERLIDLTEQQQATLESYSKFGKVGNLKQIESKLAELRREQEAQLQHLRSKTRFTNYEKEAIFEMDTEDTTIENPLDQVLEDFDSTVKDGEDAAESERDQDSVAWAGPIVIETE